MSADVVVDGDYYAVVPEWILTAEFTSNAVKLYAILRRYADKSTKMAHPSRKTLSEKMGFARPASVDVAIKELVDKGAMETFIRWRLDENGKPTGERTSNGYKLFTKRQAPRGVVPESEPPYTPERTGVVPENVQGVVPQSVGGVVRQTVQQNHSHFEPQSFEPQQQEPLVDESSTVSTRKASAKPIAGKTPADDVAKIAYDSTSGALKYMAIKGLAKWAIESKHASPDQITASIADLYGMGKPITKTTLGQHLDGHIRGSRTRPATEERMADILAIGENLDTIQHRQIGA